MIAIEHNIFTTTTKVVREINKKAKKYWEKIKRVVSNPKATYTNIKRAHRDLQHNDIKKKAVEHV